MSEFHPNLAVHRALSELPMAWHEVPDRYPPLGRLSFSEDKVRVNLRMDDMPLETLAGTLAVDEDGVRRAAMSFVAHRAPRELLGDEERRERPVIFVWNGGPISAATGWMNYELTPPVPLDSNDIVLTDYADVVYADPPGTGLGRVSNGTPEDYFYGVERDAELMYTFLCHYLRTYADEGTKIALVGCSYASFRATDIANRLLDANAPLQALNLVSPGLDYRYLIPSLEASEEHAQLLTQMNLASYAALAYGERTDARSYQAHLQEKFVDEARLFAVQQYLQSILEKTALSRGDQAMMARYTGLSLELLKQHEFVVTPDLFRSNLDPDGWVLSSIDGGRSYPPHTASQIDPLLDRERSRRVDAIAAQFGLTPQEFSERYVFNVSAYSEWSFGGEYAERDLYSALGRLVMRPNTVPIAEINGRHDLIVSPEAREVFWDVLHRDSGVSVKDGNHRYSAMQDAQVTRLTLPVGHQPGLSFPTASKTRDVIAASIDPLYWLRHFAPYARRRLSVPGGLGAYHRGQSYRPAGRSRVSAPLYSK